MDATGSHGWNMFQGSFQGGRTLLFVRGVTWSLKSTKWDYGYRTNKAQARVQMRSRKCGKMQQTGDGLYLDAIDPMAMHMQQKSKDGIYVMS